MTIKLERLQEDLKSLLQRKEEAHQSYHQICGAISIMEQMIFRLTNPDWDKPKNLPTMDVLPIEDQNQPETIQ